MIAALALSLAAQWAPPVAVRNSPPPPVLVVPGPPFPNAAPLIVAPPPPGARIVRAPQARTKLQQLVSVHDYPASALRQREQGRVAFTLDVGANGRVTGCTITGSSGSAALDSATCRIMRSRGRFTPAADSNGMPAAGRVSDAVEWRLPAEATERG